MRQLVLLTALMLPAALLAQSFGSAPTSCEDFTPPAGAERFEAVTYLTGHTGLDDQIGGTLYLTRDRALLVEDCAAQAKLTVEMAALDSVTLTDERRDPGTVGRFAFGLLAAHRQDEIVRLFLRTSQDVEVVVLRVGHHNGAGLTAKLAARRRKP